MCLLPALERHPYSEHLWEADISPHPSSLSPGGGTPRFHHPTLLFAASQPSVVHLEASSSLGSWSSPPLPSSVTRPRRQPASLFQVSSEL